MPRELSEPRTMAPFMPAGDAVRSGRSERPLSSGELKGEEAERVDRCEGDDGGDGSGVPSALKVGKAGMVGRRRQQNGCGAGRTIVGETVSLRNGHGRGGWQCVRSRFVLCWRMVKGLEHIGMTPRGPYVLT